MCPRTDTCRRTDACAHGRIILHASTRPPTGSPTHIHTHLHTHTHTHTHTESVSQTHVLSSADAWSHLHPSTHSLACWRTPEWPHLSALPPAIAIAIAKHKEQESERMERGKLGSQQIMDDRAAECPVCTYQCQATSCHVMSCHVILCRGARADIQVLESLMNPLCGAMPGWQDGCGLRQQQQQADGRQMAGGGSER